MKTTEEKRNLYVEAYDAAISDLVPDFDPAADKESGSPWCLVDFTDDIPDDFLIDKAIEHAMDHAPEIARLLADDLENADNMPRIILTDDGKYNIYDVNNCLDVFGRCENGLDFDAIKEAFNRAPKMIGFDAFKDLVKSFEESKEWKSGFYPNEKNVRCNQCGAEFSESDIEVEGEIDRCPHCHFIGGLMDIENKIF